MDNLSAKLEYLYIWTTGVTGSTTLGLANFSETANLKDSIVRFGFNYRLLGGR